MTTERGMWAGASVATHQDLSALFVVRSCELYLRPGGRFGFVMPLAALSRKQFAGFRTGEFRPATEHTTLAFDEPWDLHAVKPSIFPVPPSVVFGERSSTAVPLGSSGQLWSGRVPKHNASWSEAEHGLKVSARMDAPASPDAQSPYAAAFAQGAGFVPRVLFVVEDVPAGPLGAGPGRRAIRSRRSSNEKKPWKELPPLTGQVEDEFIFPMHLGETILPFRVQEPLQVVIPWDGSRLLDITDDALDDYPGLADWWRNANLVWESNRSSERLTLLDRVNYMRTLRQQFPVPPHRVVYSASGMYLAAARIDDERVVVDKKLYWGPAANVEEARYLTAVFNSNAFTLAVRQFQSRGEHNPRDFDKYVFLLPTPTFDSTRDLHRDLVAVAEQAESVVAGIELPPLSFQAQRRVVRGALEESGVARALDVLVERLLDPAD